MIGIYKITNPEGKIYVGQSINIHKRLKSYENNTNKNQIKIFRSINKYGWSYHKFEVIIECEASVLNELEVYYISHFKAMTRKYGLNLKTGGKNSKLSKESINKMSRSLKNRHLNDREFKIKFIQSCKERSKKLIGVYRDPSIIDKIKNTKAIRGTLKMKQSSYDKMTETKRKQFLDSPELKERLIKMREKSSGNKKKVRCILTDRKWNSCKEMCLEMGLDEKYTRKQLSGSRTNFTSYIYM